MTKKMFGIKRTGDFRATPVEFVIINDGEEEIRYLHSFDGHGPITRSTPKMFTKRAADNLLAKMRNAGMLVGDFEIYRF